MQIESGTLPTDALKDVAYLARSENRVEILGTLTTGTHDPRNVSEVTGISRQTVGRILTELERREWAERTPDGYTATAMGERIVGEFVSLVEATHTIGELEESVNCIPDTELMIGLQHFNDATIHAPVPDDPMAAVKRLMDLMGEASEFKCLVHLAPPVALEQAMRDAVVDGRLKAENVITKGELTYLRQQPDRLRRWREYLDGGASVYCYDGSIPCNLFIFDEKVLMSESHSEAEQACTFLEVEDETVQTWAAETIKRYQKEASSVDPETFAQYPTTPADHPG